MTEDLVLLLTDVVDSTRTNERWGDVAMAEAWIAHDRLARDMIHTWHGREVGRADGFIVAFRDVNLAIGFADAYHRSLAGLEPPLQARIGVHRGPMTMRENSPADIEQGAMPVELNGIALSVAARVMSIAMGGQTLITQPIVDAANDTTFAVKTHGHFRLKGIAEPLEIFEVGTASAPFSAPEDSAKAYRVFRRGTDWLPIREVPHNLPADRDSFVGRRDALSSIVDRFTERKRLVTLVGIGGMGKTRLAIHYGRDALAEYPGGVYFCDLTTARSMDGILHAVAQALDLRLGKDGPVEQIGASIARRGACLMIIDNFEQVVSLAEATVGRWLERAPEARFLITSRHTLGIVGEQSLVIAPLTREEAVHLFEQRVRATGSRDPFTAEDADAIGALVEMLDRLPLAIELAAARVRVLPPRVLLKRMGQRFNVLASHGGRHDRQATLRATLDWSWDLLSRHEQMALAQLSVFEGGFSVEAAEAVFDIGSDDAPWSADLLQTLVEKSLVRTVSATRFDLLRTVQDYAKERLDGMPGEQRVAAFRRHAAFFAGLAEHEATAERCADADNLIAACRRMGEIEPSIAAKALLNSWAALTLTGPFHAGLELASSLERSAAANPDLRMAVDRVMGGALSLLGRADAARSRYLACIRASEAAGAQAMQAQMLARIAELDMASGDLTAARTALDKALTLALDVGDAAAQYTALNGLGKFHLVQSQWREAHDRYLAALKIAEKVGHRRWQGGLHGNLGNIERLLGRPREALDNFTRAAAMASEVGDRQWEGNARCNLGLMLHETGDEKAAGRELNAALAIARQIGHRRLEAATLCNMGLVAEAGGKADAASDSYEAALQMARDIGDAFLEGQFSGYLGLFYARAGREADSRAAFERGETLLAAGGDAGSLALLHCQRASARAVLGDRAESADFLRRAETLLQQLSLSPESELGLALATARTQLAALVA